MKMSDWSAQSFKLIATIKLQELAPHSPRMKNHCQRPCEGVTLTRRHGHNHSVLCPLLFVSRRIPTLNFKCECDYRVAFIFNGLCLYVFQHAAKPGKRLTQAPFSADGAYISHIYMHCLFLLLAEPPSSSSFCRSFPPLLHLHPFIILEVGDGPRGTEGEAVPSVVQLTNGVGQSFQYERQMVPVVFRVDEQSG